MLDCCVQRNQIQPKVTGTLKPCKFGTKDMTQTMTWQSKKGWGQLEIGKNRRIYSQGSSALSAEGKGTFEARSKKLKVKHTTWMRKKKSREIKTRGKQNQSTQWRNKKDSRSKLSNKKGVKTSVKQSIYIYIYMYHGVAEVEKRDVKERNTKEKAHYF